MKSDANNWLFSDTSHVAGTKAHPRMGQKIKSLFLKKYSTGNTSVGREALKNTTHLSMDVSSMQHCGRRTDPATEFLTLRYVDIVLVPKSSFGPSPIEASHIRSQVSMVGAIFFSLSYSWYLPYQTTSTYPGHCSAIQSFIRKLLCSSQIFNTFASGERDFHSNSVGSSLEGCSELY